MGTTTCPQPDPGSKALVLVVPRFPPHQRVRHRLLRDQIEEVIFLNVIYLDHVIRMVPHLCLAKP